MVRAMRSRRFGSRSLSFTVGSFAVSLSIRLSTSRICSFRRLSWMAWFAPVTSRIAVTSPQPRQAPCPPVVA